MPYSKSRNIVAGFLKAEFKDKEMHTEYVINTAKKSAIATAPL